MLLVFRQMVYHLKTRIRYANDTLPEALYEVGKRFEKSPGHMLGETGRFFLDTAKRLEQEQNRKFSEVWKETLDASPVKKILGDIDRRNLEELGEQLGYSDREMQERTMLFYLERTDDSIASLKDQVETKGRLYRYLGVAAGLFLAVVLI